MGDVYMLNGKILSGLPNHAKDIEFDNTGTTLSSTNTEDAIKEIDSNLSPIVNDLTPSSPVTMTAGQTYTMAHDAYFTVECGKTDSYCYGKIDGQTVFTASSYNTTVPVEPVMTVFAKKGSKISISGGGTYSGRYRELGQ